MRGVTLHLIACATAFAITTLYAGAVPVMAQEGNGGTVEQRLERLEQKLDRILERMDDAAARGGIDAAGAKIPPAPASETNTDIPPPPGIPDPLPFKPGAVAIARAAPEERGRLADIPTDSVGSFVYSSGVIPLNELSRSGVRYTGLGAVELQGWLKVTVPGRTQLAVEYRTITGSNVFVDPTCITSLWLEDRSIGSQRAEIPMPARQEKTISMVFGADLEPGLYRLRAWLACTPPRDLRQLNAELLVKSPGDMNLRTITSDELLHRGG